MAKPSLKLLVPIVAFCILPTVFLLLPRGPSLPRRVAFPRFPPDLRDASSPPPPRLAYFISGSDGDGHRIWRLLLAVYHPRNRYLLHLDLRAAQSERDGLAAEVGAMEAFDAAGNVDIVGRSDFVNLGGSTPIASILHGAAILLRHSRDWDWFVNLEAWDYPLIPQDDLLHVLSFLPRDFNFIQHSSEMDENKYPEIATVIVDPGIYLAARRNIFVGNRRRTVPTAFKLFTGSPCMILSQKLVEYSILGWDNLPRTLLMYFSNTVSPHRSYFHTLACNSKGFRNTIVNSDLRFIAGNDSSAKEAESFKWSDFKPMIQSGAVFTGRHLPDSMKDEIDRSILHRRYGRLVPGAWCLGPQSRIRDPCESWGDINVLRPGPSAEGFEKLLQRLISNERFMSKLCASD